jgi:hypothetical protein
VSAVAIVVLVGSILVIVGGSVTVLVAVLTRKATAARAQLAAELALEPAILGPESGSYRGSTGSYPKVQGNGQIALTAHRLLFRKMVGIGIDVVLADVTGVKVSKTFNRSVVGGRVHLVVQTHKGDVGYFVSDTDTWVRAITAATESGSARRP